MSTTSTTSARVFISESVHPCSDGVKLATRHWANFDTTTSSKNNVNDGHSSRHRSRKILCLHGWLDNAASFNRLAPLLLNDCPSSSSDDGADVVVPTEIVALDFPGHGLSGHKSVDGPPQLLAEYAYYVAELIEALKWGGGKSSSVGVSRTVVGNINSNSNTGTGTSTDPKNNGGGGEIQKKNQDTADTEGDDKIILIGHSMGSGVATVLCAAFPEWFSSLVLLEGGLVARNAQDASKHVRAACQRRMKSNRSLFPNGSNSESGPDGEIVPVLPRARVYSNLDAAIEARLSTTRRMPGDQYLSYEAAIDMVSRATVPAPAGNGSVVFRHDPRLQWPSLQYYTREQVEAFFRDVGRSIVPVCFLYAVDGWPVDSWAESMINDVLRPEHKKRLSGSHHFHADPDSVGPAAQEIIAFLNELKL